MLIERLQCGREDLLRLGAAKRARTFAGNDGAANGVLRASSSRSWPIS